MEGLFLADKIGIIVFILLLAITPIASAGEWRGDGTPLYVIAEGKVHGDVIVVGGHGYTRENPYEEYFELPDEIKYARLYVPMWNYNEDDWIEVSINEKYLGKRTVPDYVAAWGTASYAYNVENSLSSGMNKVSVNYHNTNGAPYSIVLIAVYEDADMPQKQFWIAEGNHALSYVTNSDESEVTFRGNITGEIKDATLWTMIIAGNKDEVDELYFNSHLIAEDVGSARSGSYYDLDHWSVKDYIKPGNNTVKFNRGDESYLHPFNAVLVVNCQQDCGEDHIDVKVQAEPNEAKIPTVVIMVFVASIFFFVYRIRMVK